MKWNLILICSLFFALLSSAKAGIRDVGNGGDTLALSFLKRANTALNEASTDKDLRRQLPNKKLKRLIANLHVLVSDKPLYAKDSEATQTSVAINYYEGGKAYVIIHRQGWEEIQDPDIEKAIAFHEVLSLAGLESTGRYPISYKYLAATGKPCAKDLCFLEGVPAEPQKLNTVCFKTSDPDKSILENRALELTVSGENLNYSDTVYIQSTDSAPFSNVIVRYANAQGQPKAQIHFASGTPFNWINLQTERETPLVYNRTQSQIQGRACYSFAEECAELLE